MAYIGGHDAQGPSLNVGLGYLGQDLALLYYADLKDKTLNTVVSLAYSVEFKAPAWSPHPEFVPY